MKKLFFILILFVPIVCYAIDILNVKIDSHIEIDGSCPYRIVTDRGSFVEGQDVKEICFDSIDDSYVFNTYNRFVVDGVREKTAEFNYLYIYTWHYLFHDNSFIKVYNNDDNSLIQEITIDDFPINKYSFSEPNFLESIIGLSFPVGTYENIRIELSDDLQQLNDPYFCDYYRSELPELDIQGPWIYDSELIDKLNYLESNEIKNNYIISSISPKSLDSRIYYVNWINAGIEE